MWTSHLASQNFLKASSTSSPPVDSSTFFPPSHEDRCGSPWIEWRGRFWWILKLILLESSMTSSASNYSLVLIFMSSSLCCMELFLLLLSISSPGPLDSTLPCSYSSRISLLTPGLSSLFTLPLLVSLLQLSSHYTLPLAWLTWAHLSLAYTVISSFNFVLNPSYLLLVISSENLPFTQSQQVQNGVHPLFN